MATPKAAWGIEIGAYSIKAIRLERSGDDVSVADFAVIPHKKVLTTPDLDQEEMVRLGLGQFISQKNLEGEHLVMSVPGHTAFARFAKLPPVEPKKVPDIVKFEAVQQIPFPIDEVEWDYETFTSPDTPEIEVGIFAITRERVQQRLGLYAEVGLSPESMTLSPVAVYNAMHYDLADKLKGPVIFLDIGTSATDVIIAEAGRCWIRTFPLGGTHFTEAIASAFKLSYSKAEKLKLEASDTKYAKQIMQAMRPVFSDLLQDLQRSIGYYQSMRRDSELKTMVGVGSTFKIPGLRKFLGQQLQIDVVRLDEYKRITVTGREAAAFAENAVNMATAYGLALQGVGLAKIDANLVPVQTLREQMWHAKTKWFAAAAAIAIIGSAAMFIRPVLDGGRMKPGGLPEVTQVLGRGNELKQRFEVVKGSSDIGHSASNLLGLLDSRRIWPFLLDDVASALASTSPQPELLGEKPELILGIDPAQRRLVQLSHLQGAYVPPSQPAQSAAGGDAGSPPPGAGMPGRQGRRIAVTLQVELSHDQPAEFLNDTVAAWLRQHADPAGTRADVPYKIIAASISVNPTRRETIVVGADGSESGSQSSGTPPAPTPSPFAGPSPSTPQPPPVQGGSPDGAGGLRGDQPPVDINAGNDYTPMTSGGDPQSQKPRTGPGPATGSNPWSPTRTGAPTPMGTDAGAGDLGALAPVAPPPRLYPPNSTYFRMPITFEIELLDAPPAPPQETAGASGPQGAV